MTHLFARLYRDTRGSIIILFTILLPVMLGIAGLVIDIGRAYRVNNQLQDMADSAAIAGAAELDRGADAIQRATDAANSLAASNDTTWSSVLFTGAVIQTPVFYDENRDVTVDSTKAEYIEVTTAARGITPTFLRAVGATSTFNTSAIATAMSTYVACNVQPLMLCNPNDPDPFNPAPGALFGFTDTGNTGGLTPGDFALLDPAGQTHSGGNEIRDLLSEQRPNICYVNSLSPRTGQASGPVADGINVRFDIRSNPAPSDTTPAPNVIKGQDDNSCTGNTNGLVAQHQLPINTGMTKYGSTLIGGAFDRAGANAYWSAHHGGTWPTHADGTPFTRYEAYNRETACLPGVDCTANPLNWTGENPAPHCPVRPSGADRRIISVAVINCQGAGITGNSNPTLLAQSYAEFFLVRPVISNGSSGENGLIYAEFVRFVTPESHSTDTKLHHVVQLVR